MFSSTLESPVLVIGSAHVVDLEAPLRRVIGPRVLDAIAVELDAERAARLLSEEVEGTPRAADAPLFLRLWSVLQQRLGSEIGGGIAGAEMKAAARIARERNVPILLIDDPIRETLARLLRSLSFRERLALVLGAILGLLVPRRVVEHQIDQYADSPTEYLETMRQVYPGVTRVLLDERNEHMAERLSQIRHRGYGRVAAVVGDAHVPGLATALRRRGVPVETLRFGQLRAVRAP